MTIDLTAATEPVSAVSDSLRPLVVAWVSAQQRHLHNSMRGIATSEQRRAWEHEAETMIATARAEAWEQGRVAEERSWKHVFDGHPVPEGDPCEECLAGNPYTEGAEK